jgi:hypothetical protein
MTKILLKIRFILRKKVLIYWLTFKTDISIFYLTIFNDAFDLIFLIRTLENGSVYISILY